MDLTYIFRTFHPTKTDYVFFSSMHTHYYSEGQII